MSDCTGQAWFSLFNDTAEMLLGISADACYQLKSNVFDESAVAEYENVFSNALFKDFICRVSEVKVELYRVFNYSFIYNFFLCVCLFNNIAVIMHV